MPCFLASRSLITPLEVEIMATPRPPRTFGKPLVFLYILNQTRIASPSQFLYELPREEMECQIPTGGLSAIGLGSLAGLGSEYELEPDFHDDGHADFVEDQSQEHMQLPPEPGASLPAGLEEITTQLQTASQLAGAAQSKLAPSAYQTGMLVSHAEYGSGVILAITGKGPKRTATVRFMDQEERKFRLAFAPLTRVDHADDEQSQAFTQD